MAKLVALNDARARLDALTATPQALLGVGLEVVQDGVRRSAFQLLAHPEVSIGRLSALWPELAAIPAAVAAQLQNDGRYQGYLIRQEADVRAFRRDHDLAVPDDLDYALVASLSAEVRSKLALARPATLAAAARIPGITPAALTALLAHVRRRRPARRSA